MGSVRNSTNARDPSLARISCQINMAGTMLSEMLIATPNIYIVLTLLLAATTLDVLFLKFAVIVFANELLNAGLKFGSRTIYERTGWIADGARPSGCGVRNPMEGECRGCGILASSTPSTSWGMPSGHAQIAFMSAAFWTLVLMDGPGQTTRTLSWVTIVGLWALAAAVSAQRMWSRCHSPLQVGVGGLIGVVSAWVAWRIVGSPKLQR